MSPASQLQQILAYGKAQTHILREKDYFLKTDEPPQNLTETHRFKLANSRARFFKIL